MVEFSKRKSRQHPFHTAAEAVQRAKQDRVWKRATEIAESCRTVSAEDLTQILYDLHMDKTIVLTNVTGKRK